MGDDEPRLVGYRIIRELATGSCSTVYLAESLQGRQHHALKIFNRENPSNATRHWLAEAEVLSRTSHPNLALLCGFGQTLLTNQGYLSLEYIQGQDFVSASKTVSQHHFYAMLVQLCRVLDHLHRRGIKHGDLTPQNILVLKDPHPSLNPPLVKVFDLAFSGGSLGQPKDRLEGSPHYLAPEVIGGSQPTITSDLYSLGAVLYECLSGAPPFPGSDIGSVLQRHLGDTPARIEGEALKELHPIIYQLLQKDPSKRPSSPWELMRLINANSTVGHFQLNTPDTWSAQVRASALTGRDSLLSEVTEHLSRHLRRSERPRPLSIVIRGATGAGKTTLLTEIAIRARALGYRIFIPFARGPHLDIDQLIQGMNTTLSDPVSAPLLLAYDEIEGVPSDRPLLNFVISAEPHPAVLLLSLNTSRLSTQDTRTITEHIGRRYDLREWTLQALDSECVADATRVIGGVTRTDPRISTFLSAQSGGCPSIFTKLLLSLLDQGIITIEGYDSLALRGDLGHLTLPDELVRDVQRLCETRPPDEMKALRILALANDPLGTSEISHLAQISLAEAERVADSLEHCGILQSHGVEATKVFSLSGELLRAGLANSLTPTEQATLHEALARWYLSAVHKPLSLDRAASHFVDARLRPEAILYCLQAAQKAERTRDFHRAVHFYRCALDQHPESTDTRAEAVLGLARGLCGLSRPVEAQRLLQHLQTEIDSTNRHLAGIQIQLADCALRTGDLLGSESAARKAKALAIRYGWEDEIIEAMLRLGLALCWQERRTDGCRILFKAASKARRVNRRPLVAEALWGVASSHWKSGNYQLALNYEHRRHRLAQSGDYAPSQTAPGFNVGMLRAQLGRYAESRARLRAESAAGSETVPAARAGKLFINIGETYRIQGHWRAALKQYQSAHQVLCALETSADLPIAESNLAHTFAMTGFYTVARHLLRSKAPTANRTSSAHVTCSRLLNLATVLLSTGNPEKARRLLGLAHRLAQSAHYGQLFLELRVFMSLSSARLGASSEARKALSEALDEYGERAPFDVRLSAHLALAQIELALGSPMERLDAVLKPTLEKARAKKMRWHLAWGLRLWGEALLGASRAEEAEAALREAAEVSRKSAERPGFW